MTKLYLDAFTKGEYAQYITSSDAQTTIDTLIDSGFGIIATDNDNLAGFSLFTSLANDIDFPTQNTLDIDKSRSLYIAEVVVQSSYRGLGIATNMINDALEKYSSGFSNVVIRVWKNNKPALLLYQKLGFTAIANIYQTKYKDNGDTFVMDKIYLVKKL